MKKSGLAAVTMFAGVLCGCDHPTTPAASVASESPKEPVAEAPPTASEGALRPAPPHGKRAPCTTDQSCNGDPSVNALWGRCVQETGVCECNAGFELHPGGSCHPLPK